MDPRSFLSKGRKKVGVGGVEGGQRTTLVDTEQWKGVYKNKRKIAPTLAY